MYYVYIISNANDTVLYTGVTNDLIRRIFEHKNKLVEGFTSRYNINKLLYYESASEIESAIAREKQIKKYGRKKKMDLIFSMNKNLNDLFDQLIIE
jgi:putative endonuclease